MCDFWTGLDITQPHTLITDYGTLTTGEVYGRLCAEVGNRVNNFFDNITWDPGDPSNGLGPTTREMRDVAEDLLPLVAAQPELSPDGAQVTGLETWLWPGVDRTSGPVYASAGGVEVAVRGRLTSMQFTPGDGEPAFTCADFSEWRPGADEPACSYTYFVQPDGGTWQMTAETTWTVDWQDWYAASPESVCLAHGMGSN